MRFHILTLFPEMVRQGLETSIIGRAVDRGLLELNTVNIRDFTLEKHGRVDDYTYGGGAGMLMQAQPVFDAWKSVCGEEAAETALLAEEENGQEKTDKENAGEEKIGQKRVGEKVNGRGETRQENAGEEKTGQEKGGEEKIVGERTGREDAGERTYRRIRTIYVTPQGEPFTQRKAQELAEEKELIILCGHYEGIDERILEEAVTDYISIGDYVLTGGELAAMVIVDAVARLVPGVLGNETSAEAESFHGDLLEYPQYSRPEVWHGKRVPEVLLSGNHSKIKRWRLERAKERTRERRPDMYARYERKERVLGRLLEHKRDNIHMIESLARGRGEILYENGGDILIYERGCDLAMLTVTDRKKGEELLELVPAGVRFFQLSQEFMISVLKERMGMQVDMQCVNACYTAGVQLSVRHKDIRSLTAEDAAYVRAHYPYGSLADVEERIGSGAMFGAYVDGTLAGFAGEHKEGSIGMLFVLPEFRGRGIGRSLEAFLINRHLTLGYTPYGQIVAENEASYGLQERIGLYLSKGFVWWMSRKESR